jgi:hypothetical protein
MASLVCSSKLGVTTNGRLKVVLEGKRKIVRVDGLTNKEDYKGYQEMPPFGANVPYLSSKRVTNLLTYGLITMRPSLLIHLS